jgi:hypothetical protein
MSAYDDAYILTSGRPTGARSYSVVAAAIAVVCVACSMPVMQQLMGSQVARANAPTTARAWDLQPRWWPGVVPQAGRQASIAPDDDLTFTKGYTLRVAARQAASAARVAASAPASESQFGRSAVVVRNAAAFARADGAPTLRRVAAARIDARDDRTGPLGSGSHALAFGEQRPSQRGFAESQSGLFASLFGNLN